VTGDAATYQPRTLVALWARRGLAGCADTQAAVGSTLSSSTLSRIAVPSLAGAAGASAAATVMVPVTATVVIARRGASALDLTLDLFKSSGWF
jgi:hypothetical protein